MRKVVSRDGTTIAYEKTGEGPPIVLLNGAFRDHTIFDSLVPELAPRCTTYTYDRRGRGESGDAPEYAVEREIEDLEAMIEETGGQAVVFAGVDLLDGTPVVDLKPYVTRFDRPPGDPRCGWFDELAMTEGTTPAQLARGEPPT